MHSHIHLNPVVAKIDGRGIPITHNGDESVLAEGFGFLGRCKENFPVLLRAFVTPVLGAPLISLSLCPQYIFAM